MGLYTYPKNTKDRSTLKIIVTSELFNTIEWMEDYILSLPGCYDSEPHYKIYPNPAISHVIMDYKICETHCNTSVRIYNSLQQIVYNERLYESKDLYKIDISTFSSGMYIITLTSDLGVEWFKLIKQ